MPSLRTRAIDEAIAGWPEPSTDTEHAIRASIIETIDRLLAANLLHDQDATVTGDGSGTALPLLRGDDEARIRRATRALHIRTDAGPDADTCGICRADAIAVLAAADQEEN